jgi:hypothetical protein
MITYKPLPIEDPSVTYNLSWKKHNTQQFADTYKQWILSSKNAKVSGLEKFNYYLTDGVTGAYSDFEKAYPDLQSVAFRGEYPFHRDTGVKRIEHILELQQGQKLYISYPFAAHGNVHFLFHEMLKVCETQNIPVFIDCAYFGACSFDELNVDYNCIKFVAFSMSKAFATGRCKIGLCFTNLNNTYMALLNEYSYVNHVSIGIHKHIIDNFTPDYMFEKYRTTQLDICEKYDIDASDTVFLAYSYNPRQAGFDRDGTVSRYGISDLLVNGYDRDIQWISKK